MTFRGLRSVCTMRPISRAFFSKSLTLFQAFEAVAPFNASEAVSIFQINGWMNKPFLEKQIVLDTYHSVLRSGVQPNVTTFQLLARHRCFSLEEFLEEISVYSLRFNFIMAAEMAAACDTPAAFDELVGVMFDVGLLNRLFPRRWDCHLWGKACMAFLEKMGNRKRDLSKGTYVPIALTRQAFMQCAIAAAGDPPMARYFLEKWIVMEDFEASPYLTAADFASLYDMLPPMLKDCIFAKCVKHRVNPYAPELVDCFFKDVSHRHIHDVYEYVKLILKYSPRLNPAGVRGALAVLMPMCAKAPERNDIADMCEQLVLKLTEEEQQDVASFINTAGSVANFELAAAPETANLFELADRMNMLSNTKKADLENLKPVQQPRERVLNRRS